jgi:hypothetical protein
MTDSFRSHTRSLTSPPEHARAILPSDVGDLPQVTRALYVGGDGDLAVVMRGGEEVTFAGLSGGTLLPIRVSRVLATGTTATGIVGLW